MLDFRTFNTIGEQVHGKRIAEAYSKGDVNGWGGPELAEEQFQMIGNTANFIKSPFTSITDIYKGTKTFLYQVCRKVLQADTKNYPQQIGDCVSFGAKNASEYVTCCEILMKGERQKFRPVFPPYYYGSGRLYIGNGRLGNEDGSLGSWMAAAVMKYGTLFSDEQDVPAYAGSVAKKWGGPGGRSYLDKYKENAQRYLVKSAAQIQSWEELVAAIANGYPCTVASNQGFQMEASSDGFHQASGNWGHQMCFIGVDDTYSQPYALILNNWGDVHGHLKSFYGDEALPLGVLRVKKSVAQRMIDAGETFAFSNFDGFPEQDINEQLFKVIGN